MAQILDLGKFRFDFKGAWSSATEYERNDVVRYGGNVAQVTELTDNGGGPARLIEAVAGLCIYNPLAFGKFDFSA